VDPEVDNVEIVIVENLFFFGGGHTHVIVAPREVPFALAHKFHRPYLVQIDYHVRDVREFIDRLVGDQDAFDRVEVEVAHVAAEA